MRANQPAELGIARVGALNPKNWRNIVVGIGLLERMKSEAEIDKAQHDREQALDKGALVRVRHVGTFQHRNVEVPIDLDRKAGLRIERRQFPRTRRLIPLWCGSVFGGLIGHCGLLSSVPFISFPLT